MTSRSRTAHATEPILLALLGGSVLLVLCALSSTAIDRSGPIGTPLLEAARAEPTRVASTAAPGERSRVAPPVLEQRASHATEELESLPAVARPPATEREFRALFLREARAGLSLEERARAVLEGRGPRCEKVAFLLALEDAGSPETAAWLEFALRTLPDESDAHAVSLPSFALDRLAGRAVRDEAARAALTRVAFDRTRSEVDLRRRAAAHLAAVATGDELGALRWELAREPDELLVAGVLSALEGRAGEPVVRSLLDAYARPERSHSPEE